MTILSESSSGNIQYKIHITFYITNTNHVVPMFYRIMVSGCMVFCQGFLLHIEMMNVTLQYCSFYIQLINP